MSEKKSTIKKAWVKAPVKATHNQMIAEAVERMKLIGLHPSYIEAFESDWTIPTFYTPEGDDAGYVGDDVLGFFLKENHGEARAVITDLSDTEGGIIKKYILFVSDNPNTWEKEREELAAMNPTVCLIREDLEKMLLSNPGRPVEYLTKELIKTKISVTKDGTLVLDGNYTYNRVV